MAYVVQIRRRSGVAWGFFGTSGSGKGWIADMMRQLVGARNTSMNKTDVDLQSTFNPYAMHKLIVHLNEVASDFHGRHGVAGKLKSLVSDPILTVNQKGIPEVEVDNYANIIMNSNKPNPIELDADDRRWNMIVSNKALKDCDWWYEGAYKDAIAEYNKLGAYLMNYDVDIKFAENIMEMNEAKANVIAQTTSDMAQLGKAINDSDTKAIINLLGIEKKNVFPSIEDIKWCGKYGRWSNEILNRMVGVLVGSDVKTHEMRRKLTLPFLKGVKGDAFKDINNKTVNGVHYDKV